MPKSKQRKKPAPRPRSPRDPALGQLLAGRGWRYLGEGEIADAWDYPPAEAQGGGVLITVQPYGYAGDLIFEGTHLLSKRFRSRQDVLAGLPLMEAWGDKAGELRRLAAQS